MNVERAYDGLIGKHYVRYLLRIYDVGGELLGGIKSIYAYSLACVRIKGG